MTLGRMRGQPNKGMKLTNLSEAPGETEAPLRAFRRFAAVRTGSQLIPGVRWTRWRERGVASLLGVSVTGRRRRTTRTFLRSPALFADALSLSAGPGRVRGFSVR